MKLGVLILSIAMMTATTFASESIEQPIKEIVKDGQQVRFYNDCSSSVDFYVKGSGGTTRYTVSAKSSKNVSVSVGDKILDSSRNEIITITSSTDKVVVCE